MYHCNPLFHLIWHLVWSLNVIKHFFFLSFSWIKLKFRALQRNLFVPDVGVSWNSSRCFHVCNGVALQRAVLQRPRTCSGLAHERSNEEICRVRRNCGDFPASLRFDVTFTREKARGHFYSLFSVCLHKILLYNVRIEISVSKNNSNNKIMQVMLVYLSIPNARRYICHIARKRNVTVVYLYINIIMSACTMNLHLHDSAAEKENITNMHVTFGVFRRSNTRVSLVIMRLN